MAHASLQVLERVMKLGEKQCCQQSQAESRVIASISAELLVGLVVCGPYKAEDDDNCPSLDATDTQRLAGTLTAKTLINL